MAKPETVEQYLDGLPDDVRDVVTKIRSTIHDAVPGGEDCISYAIPAVKVQGKVLMYYSGWKSHVSVYPIPPGAEAFERKLAPYITGKGTLKFPLDKPVPYKLIADVAKAHYARLQADAAKKAAKKVASKK